MARQSARQTKSPVRRPQRLRCTKFALLLFGAGLVLGLVVATAEIDALARTASLVMALGIIAIPAGALLDWRRAAGSAGAAPARRQRRSRGGQRNARAAASRKAVRPQR